MAGHIPDIALDRIRADIDLVEALERYTGSRFHRGKIACPFHSEKSASLSVKRYPDGSQRYHCFGCGAKGDVVELVRRLYGLSFPDAVRKLDADFILGLELSRDQATSSLPYDQNPDRPEYWHRIGREIRELEQADILTEIRAVSDIHRKLFRHGLYEAAAIAEDHLELLEALHESYYKPVARRNDMEASA